MRLRQAKHNEEVCNYLRSCNKNYDDWVVTTSFYSAIHYIQNELFPNQYEDPQNGNVSRFINFDSYVKRVNTGENKHKILQNLVDEYMGEISDSYQTLKENCWNARYIDYNMAEGISDLCIVCMEDIRDLCS